MISTTSQVSGGSTETAKKPDAAEKRKGMKMQNRASILLSSDGIGVDDDAPIVELRFLSLK